MGDSKATITPLIKDSISEIIGGEDILIEAVRDLIRDEIKQSIRKRLEDNPELRKELKDAIGMYFEAKVKEAYAGVKIAKAGAKLGLELIPSHLKAEVAKELEKEITSIIEGAFRTP